MLRACLFAHFDATQGPQVVHQMTATDTKSDFQFEYCSDYIIPKHELCNQRLSVAVDRQRVLGFPVLVEDSKYHRNAYLFNMCFVMNCCCRSGGADVTCDMCSMDLSGYEAAVERLGRALWKLEVEEEFLSFQRDDIALVGLMRQVVSDLSSGFETLVRFGRGSKRAAYLLHLSVNDPLASTDTRVDISEHQVPVLLDDQMPECMDESMDLSLKRVIQALDGVKTVKLIVKKTCLHPNLVKRILQYLARLELIDFIDWFQQTNIYRLTHEFQLNVKENDDHYWIQRLMNYSLINKQAKYTVMEIFRLISDFNGYTPANDILSNPKHAQLLKHLDMRRLIAHLVLAGWLKRVYKIPFLIRPLHNVQPEIRQLIDGTRNLDEIATRLDMDSVEKIEVLIEGSAAYIYQ